jgi:hypothetical protein
LRLVGRYSLLLLFAFSRAPGPASLGLSRLGGPAILCRLARCILARPASFRHRRVKHWPAAGQEPRIKVGLKDTAPPRGDFDYSRAAAFSYFALKSSSCAVGPLCALVI